MLLYTIYVYIYIYIYTIYHVLYTLCSILCTLYSVLYTLCYYYYYYCYCYDDDDDDYYDDTIECSNSNTTVSLTRIHPVQFGVKGFRFRRHSCRTRP